MNMPLFFSNDARTHQIEFKNSGNLRETYNAYEGLRMPGLDWDSLCALPGSDWDTSQVLKMSLT